MSDSPPPPPRSSHEAALNMATTAVDSLRRHPALMALVLLNCLFVFTSGFYILKVEEYRAADRKVVADFLSRCFDANRP